MFKKIEIWILYLVLLLGLPVSIGFGLLVRQELVGSTKLGRVSKTALFITEIPVTFKKLMKGFKVEDRFPTLDSFDGTPNINESYMLFSKYSGDLREGIVELIDLRNFKVLHTWNPDIKKFNQSIDKINEFKYLNIDNNNSRFLLRHPILLNDGGLIFQNNSPLIKVDACSNLIFKIAHDNFHHSIEKDIEGNIWVPSHMYPQSLPIEKVGRNIWEKEGYYDDAIVQLSPSGEILFEKSVSQIFIDNGMEYLLFGMGDQDIFSKNPIHLNDIQPVNSDGDFWKKGDVFLSLRHQSMVLLYRPLTNKIIWKGTGPFFHQHDVDILNNHKISIFNNNSKNFVGGDVVDGNNEVIIYDFKTNQYSTYLEESLKKLDVRTITEGRSQILLNGDLFVEESNYGRTLYFNSDGSLRWSHVNRAKDGKTYTVSWSRILYDEKDIQLVDNFLQSRGECNL